MENIEYHETEVQARQAELEIRDKENEHLKEMNLDLNEKMVYHIFDQTTLLSLFVGIFFRSCVIIKSKN